MAELSQLYGSDFNDGPFEGHEEEEDRKKNVKSQQPQQIEQYKPPQHSQQQQQHSQQQQQQQQYQQPHTQKPSGIEKFQNMYRRDEVTFWDKLSYKRPEVIKLAIFSLVIVLAIAIDRIGTHYLTKYLADNIFTNLQEFMIRLSYPIVVFLVIWLIKAM